MESNSNSNSAKEEVKQIQSICNINKIKSSYILKRIFNNIDKGIFLKIIKYNKKTQKRLNIDLNNYNYYSQIEIEVIPSLNQYGKFINILNEEERYFHIYFNNNKEEIKRNCINKNENVSKIKMWR